jgi:uncharacterized membrane protein YagU involved in acid resistance
MSTASVTASPERSMSRTILTVLAGGLLAGLLDITYACVASWVLRGTSPVRILQSVASGLLGASSFDGGAATAVLGTILHFFIACTAAFVYFGASQKLRALARMPFVWGPLYGIAIYVFMNYVVLPLSAVPPRATPLPLGIVVTGLLVHMFCIGLPIALAVRRASETRA